MFSSNKHQHLHHKVLPFLKQHTLFRELIEFSRLKEQLLSSNSNSNNSNTTLINKQILDLLMVQESIRIQPLVWIVHHILKCKIIKKELLIKEDNSNRYISLKLDILRRIHFHNKEVNKLSQISDRHYIKELRDTQQGNKTMEV